MKQSSSNSRSRTAFDNQNYSGVKNFSSLRDDVDDEDDDDEMTMMSMAAILLQLKNQDLEYGLPYSWGRKRRRSAMDLTPASSPLALPPPGEPPRGAVDDGDGLEENESVSLAQENNKEKKATSPSTPLSFSPSESDEKSANIIVKRPTPSKIFTKKRKEELLHEVSKLTETRDTLRREIEIVRQYYEEQRTLNLKLKVKKIKLITCDDDKERAADMETKKNNLNLGIQLAQPQQVKTFQGQLQPSITDLRLHPTAVAVGGASCDELQSHFELGMSLNRRGGHHDRVPDLNLTSDEVRDVDYFPPLDGEPRGGFFLSTDWCRAFSAEATAKAQAAEARKNRMQICKVKIKNSAAKYRQGHR